MHFEDFAADIFRKVDNASSDIAIGLSGSLTLANQSVSSAELHADVAGGGLTGGNGSVLAVGAGSLIDVQANQVDVDLTEAAAATIADGDHIIFLDGGASGGASKGDISDLVDVMVAGDSVLSNSNSQITVAVNSTSFQKSGNEIQLKSGVDGTGLTLSSHALNVDAAQPQISTVGVLGSGSIASGFGAIDIGSSALTAGTGSLAELSISGDLTVNGSVTTVNSTTLQIDDKNIDLAHSPGGSEGNNAAVDGGGITLKSSQGDKTFQYENSSTSWAASENLKLADGKSYMIDGSTVLSEATLGSSVLASSLTSLGTIASLVATTADINNGTVDAVIGGTTPKSGSFTDIIATGDVDLGNANTDTITANGRFDSALVPSADSSYELGSSTLQWSEIHVDEIHADSFGDDWTNAGRTVADLGAITTVDINGGTIDGMTIATSNVTVGSGKTLNVSAGTLTTSQAQKLAIVEGVGADTDIGSFDLRAQTLTADSLTAARIVFTGDNGLLSVENGLAWNSTTNVLDMSGGSLQASTGSFSAGAEAVALSSVGGATFKGIGATATGPVGFFANGDDSNAMAAFISGSSAINGDALHLRRNATKLMFSDLDGSAPEAAIGYFNTGNALQLSGSQNLVLLAGQSNSEGIELGVDGGGSNVTMYGAANDEGLFWNADANTLTLKDSSDAAIVTMGGDASTEYAITVGSANSSNSHRILAGAYQVHSDRDLKKDIEPMTDGLDRVMKLQPVTYEMKANPGQTDFGFIAQDVAKVAPEIVGLDKDGIGRSIDYSRMSAMLAGAVKAQQLQIDELKTIISKLQEVI